MGSWKLFHGRKAGVLLVAMLCSSLAIVSTASAQNRQGYLGVTTQTLTDELREGLDYQYDGDGALINNVSDGSPADRAGLRTGDIITAINSESISGSSELRRVIRGLEEGDLVTVRIVRNGSSRSLRVRLSGIDDDEVTGEPEFEWRTGPTPPTPPSAPRAPRAPSAPRTFWFNEDGDDDGLKGLKELDSLKDLEAFRGGAMMGMLGRGRLGVRIEDLDDDLAEYFRVPSRRGALVMSVTDDSPAQQAGIRRGDVITRFGDRSVSSSDDLMRAVREAEAGTTRVTVMRHGATRTLTVDLQRRETPRVMRLRAPEAERERARAERLRERTGREGSGMQQELDELRREVERLRRELERRDDR